MRRSIGLRAEPTVRQTEAILQRVERALQERGVPATRQGPGRLRFTMPPLWTAPRAGVLHAVSSGAALVSAGAGEPRQVRYELSFGRLRLTVAMLTAVLVVAGFGWPRLTLFNAVVVLWLVAFGLPRVLATREFRRIMHTAARDVIERRRLTRDAGASGATGTTGEHATNDAASPGDSAAARDRGDAAPPGAT